MALLFMDGFDNYGPASRTDQAFARCWREMVFDNLELAADARRQGFPRRGRQALRRAQRADSEARHHGWRLPP